MPHRWRTKQNLDYTFLMMYARSRGTYYVQVRLLCSLHVFMMCCMSRILLVMCKSLTFDLLGIYIVGLSLMLVM